MKEFYYQIKGKRDENDHNGLSRWMFPPIFSGKVEAENRDEAKKFIEEKYNKNFPLKVLKKDLDSNEFLLSIEEIKEGSHIGRLFEKQICKHCNNTFYVIDKYNDKNCLNKGFEFCSDECKIEYNEIKKYMFNDRQNLLYEINNIEKIDENIEIDNIIEKHLDNKKTIPIIYKITNKATNLSYIGKTIQIFTLRWYQHFYQKGNCKFHNAIKNSNLIDWNFEIIEIVKIPKNAKTINEIDTIILERERYWINYYNTINEGYNTL